MSDVATVRRFNRFYTRWVGALNEHLLDSAYSLPQVRVLFEIANAPAGQPLSASELGRQLRLDSGYVSRLLTTLEGDGLIGRVTQPGRGRRRPLALTAAGRDLIARLEADAAAEVAALLQPLDAGSRRELVGAMNRIRRLLGDPAPPGGFTLREPQPGDLGWVVHRQARLYAEAYGWTWAFEGLIADITGRFVRDFQPQRERCWIAEREGDVVGAVFVVQAETGADTAQLRMLYVEPSARGAGIGRALVDECLRFATAAGYRRMVLWTNDILVSARRIYQAAGFQLVGEERHHSFGHDLVGQTWARDL